MDHLLSLDGAKLGGEPVSRNVIADSNTCQDEDLVGRLEPHKQQCPPVNIPTLSFKYVTNIYVFEVNFD